MKLSTPFEIGSRLMPAVRVGTCTISCDLSGRQTRDGRDIYTAWIDLPDGTEHEITDLRSGCQGGSIRDGMACLLSFLSAAGESHNYARRSGRSGDNADLFEPAIVEWAAMNTDELSMLEPEIEENPACVEED